MKNLTALVLLMLVLWTNAFGQAQPLFAQDDKIEQLKNFWVKIFTQYSDQQTLIHDEIETGIVYKVVDHKNAEHFQRIKKMNRELNTVKSLLRSISNKNFKNLNADESELLAKIPEDKQTRAQFKKLSLTMRYQQGMSNRFYDGLVRSARFIKSIKEVLAKYKLPEELAYLPHVESSFNYFATSKVGAAGIWQLMPLTARQYKLRVTDNTDDRLDPIKSTEVAVKLLRDNFKLVKSWPLAITAYNHGTKNIRNTIKRLKTYDAILILDSINKSSFKFASRNFYPSYLAAVEVSKNKKIFFPDLNDKEDAVDELILGQRMKISQIIKKLGLSLKPEDLKTYNPQLLGVAWRSDFSLPKGFVIKYPKTELSLLTATNSATALSWTELKSWFDEICGVYRHTIASNLE